MNKPEGGPQGTGDLLSAGLVMLVYFVYMLTLAFAPEFFAAPISEGSTISIGLASGVGMAMFMVVFSAWYTHRRNSRETDGENFDTRH